MKEDSSPENIIHFKITGSHPEFARKVLNDKTYKQIFGQKEDLMVSVAPLDQELFSFKTHPMIGNALHYQALLKRTGLFLFSQIDDMNLAREIIMYYQIYLDPVVVTSIEHHLWTCPKAELQRVASINGFPVGEHLADIKRQRAFTDCIERFSVIKAIVDVSGIANCLLPTSGSKFLLTVRSGEGDKHWVDNLIY
jgi:hypothetical protein